MQDTTTLHVLREFSYPRDIFNKKFLCENWKCWRIMRSSETTLCSSEITGFYCDFCHVDRNYKKFTNLVCMKRNALNDFCQLEHNCSNHQVERILTYTCFSKREMLRYRLQNFLHIWSDFLLCVLCGIEWTRFVGGHQTFIMAFLRDYLKEPFTQIIERWSR